MNDSNLRINKLRASINILTALSFLLLSAYQTYLFAVISASRIGRMLGIISFVLIALGAAFALIPTKAFRVIRTILILGGLLLNFSAKLLNAQNMFTMLDFDYIPSVLNCGMYVVSQTGELILFFYYLVFRHNRKLNSKRKLVVAMMSVVIVLYISWFVMECVMLMKYRMHIDLNRKFTFFARALLCFGYVSMAFSFILPIKEIENPDNLMNQPPDDNDLLFSDSKSSLKKHGKNKKKHLPEGYNDLLFSDFESSLKKHDKNKKKKKHLPEGYDDLLFSDSESSFEKHDKNKKKHLPEGYNDLLFSDSESNFEKHGKNKKNIKKKHLSEGYDDFVL